MRLSNRASHFRTFPFFTGRLVVVDEKLEPSTSLLSLVRKKNSLVPALLVKESGC